MFVFSLFYDPLCQNKDFSEITFPIRRNDTLPAGNFGYPENLVEDILQVWGKFGQGVRLILNSTLYLGASPDFRSKVPTTPSPTHPSPPQNRVWPEGLKDNSNLVP